MRKKNEENLPASCRDSGFIAAPAKDPVGRTGPAPKLGQFYWPEMRETI